MRKKLFKKIFALSSILSAMPLWANAGLVGDLIGGITNAAISGIVLVISYVLGFIAQVVFYIGGVFLDFALAVNMHLLDNPFIKTGWSIVLNFTNLGFVLAIIVIAFATIVGLQSYGMKKTLWKLIVAALLVNFSLAIAGFFIEASDGLTNFFIGKIQGTSQVGLSTKLAAVINPQFMLSGQELSRIKAQVQSQNPQTTSSTAVASSSEVIDSSRVSGDMGIIFKSDEETKAFVADTPSANPFGTALKGIATLLFIALFTILAALTFLGLAGMLLIRYIYLTFLLILSPVIWLAWIFPSTAQWWKWWWKKLLHWLIFAPMVLFFLYLTIYVINADANQNVFSQYAPKNLSNQPITIDVGYISQLVMILGILMGGLILSSKLGTVGSKAAFGAAEGLMKGVGAWGKKLPLKTGGWALRRAGLSDKAAGLEERLKGGGKVSQWFAGRVGKAGKTFKRAEEYKPDNLSKSIIDGMKKGSGLFVGKKKSSEWTCSVCGAVVKSTKEPVLPCKNMGLQLTDGKLHKEMKWLAVGKDETPKKEEKKDENK
ncbi:MAG: hypothetical protein NUV83_00575 [Candidatus Wolfebacteria bacterium]|nr:hypothetical protein [Candidatus Wolfebacteria bacterium]